MGSDVLLYWEQQDFDYWCHEDLSNDNDVAGKVQTDILYRIDDKITITTLTLALLL